MIFIQLLKCEEQEEVKVSNGGFLFVQFFDFLAKTGSKINVVAAGSCYDFFTAYLFEKVPEYLEVLKL